MIKFIKDRWPSLILCAIAVVAVVWAAMASGWVDREPQSVVQTIRIGTAMPRTIDVMGTAWRVVVVRFPDTSMQGLTECDKHVILMSGDGVHPQQTLIHELLHAAVCHYDARTHDFEPANLWYNSKTEDGHEGFNNIAGVISELLARNPDLAQYEADGDVSLGTVSIR